MHPEDGSQLHRISDIVLVELQVGSQAACEQALTVQAGRSTTELIEIMEKESWRVVHKESLLEELNLQPLITRSCCNRWSEN